MNVGNQSLHSCARCCRCHVLGNKLSNEICSIWGIRFNGVTVSKFGLESLIPLGKLVIIVYGAMIFFVIVVLGITAKIVSMNIFQVN